MSPAAKTPGALVSRYSSTTTPRSIASPASSASASRGRTPTPDDDEVGGERRAVVERHRVASMRCRLASEVETHAVLFVQRPDERRRAPGPCTRSSGTASGADDVHLELARAQRRRDLEADEARADHDRALALLRRRDDGAAVGQRAQVVHVRQILAGQAEMDRLGAGREQQRVVWKRRALPRAPPSSRRCRCASPRAAHEIDVMLGVEVRRAQRDPLLGRVAGEVVLREVRPVVRANRIRRRRS